MSRSPGHRHGLPPDLDPRAALARAGRGARGRKGRLSLVLAALLSTAVLMVSSVGWAAVRYVDSSIKRVTVNVTGKRPPERPDEMNVLLIGSDSREGTNGEYGTQAEVGGLHSDTVIVAHLGADGSATMVSIPRDTLVDDPPGMKPNHSDGKDKFTDVLSSGGISATIKVVEDMTGLHINHFIVIDLAGFKKMTDAVGGVTVCVAPLPGGGTANLNDQDAQWHGHLGNNTLNGDQALSFVRTRHALGDERLRIQRQQVFLSDLLHKATSAGVLTNPVKVANLLGAVGGSLQVDSGLSRSALVKLADRLREITGGARFVTVPTHVALPSDGATDDKGYVPPHGDVLIFDQAKAEPILAPLRPAVAKKATTGTTTTAPTLPPASVTISEVLNASGRSGVAASTRLALSNRGFTAMAAQTGTAPSTQATTEIRYPAGQEAAASTLAAAIPGATAVADPTASGLVVVVGQSYGSVSSGSGARSGAAGSAAPAAPGPTAAPAAPNCTP